MPYNALLGRIFFQKIIFCFVIWLCSILLFFGTTRSAASETASFTQLEKITLQLRWQHQFQFAGYYAAIAKGYYEEVGLEIIIKEGGPDIDSVAEVVNGNAEYGISNSDILLKRLQNQPVVLLATIFQHSPVVIIARAEKGIHTPQDLIGKKLMM
ncbi:MAG: ABC transporter substrate-binding protein, partial [Desulfobacteraceae bacterium]